MEGDDAYIIDGGRKVRFGAVQHCRLVPREYMDFTAAGASPGSQQLSAFAVLGLIHEPDSCPVFFAIAMMVPHYWT